VLLLAVRGGGVGDHRPARPIVQAGGIKSRTAKELGPSVEIHGGVEYAFPIPKSLATLDGSPGLTARKVEHLRQLGWEAAGGN
jgi:hypothetical protein